MFALLLIASACGDGSIAPDRELPRLGVYDYWLAVPFIPAAQNEARFVGTLRITYASPDSIQATVDVPTGYYPAFQRDFEGLRPSIRFGFWNNDAYYFWVEGRSGGPTVAHRVTPSNGILTCKAILLVAGAASPTPYPASCGLTLRSAQ